MIQDEVVIGIGCETALVAEAGVEVEVGLEGMIVGELEVGFEAHYVVVEGVILGRELGLELGPVKMRGVFLESAMAKVEIVGVVCVSDAGKEVMQAQVETEVTAAEVEEEISAETTVHGEVVTEVQIVHFSHAALEAEGEGEIAAERAVEVVGTYLE